MSLKNQKHSCTRWVNHKECTKKPGTKVVSGKNDLKPEVRNSRDPFYYMVYSLLTKKIERKNCPWLLPRTTATRLFLAECPIGGMGEICFHALSSGIPTSHSPGRLLASVKRIPLGTPSNRWGIPYFSFKCNHGSLWAKINGLCREEEGLSQALPVPGLKNSSDAMW